MDSAKRSVLISILGIVAAIALMVGVGFGIARRVGHSVREITDVRVEETRTSSSVIYDLASFDSIQIEGGWKVSLTKGESFAVDIEASKKVLEQINVFVSGDTLHLEMEPGIRSVTGNLQAVVRLPDLERVSMDGGVSVDLAGFELDRLQIDVDGAASFTSTGGRIEDLHIESDGAASFDLSGTPVYNADIDLDGASNMDLQMAGGELTGVIRGLGNVTFSGDVLRQDVDVEGLGRIHRD